MDNWPIVYLPTAIQDLIDILDYVRRDAPASAAGLIDDLDEKIGTLATFPHLGRVARDHRLSLLGYRMLVVRDYLVFYVIKEGSVEVRRVIHGKRRYQFLLEE